LRDCIFLWQEYSDRIHLQWKAVAAWVIEGDSPARACVEAGLARPELLVEITVIAAVIKPESK
jgi:enamine deaminase RidA (YjgF/YER057c/UK114 family)